MTLTAKDIASIIKTCKNAGISEFQQGELRLKFFESVPQANLKMTDRDNLIELERTIAKDDDLREMRIQNLMISDPLRYEELMRNNYGED
jgi:hypothetical protein